MFKKSCLVLISITLVSACSTGTGFDPISFFKGDKPEKVCDDYQSISEEEANTRMNLEIYELQHNVERSLVFRELIAEKLDVINKLTKQEEPFPPAFIDKLSQAMQEEIDLMRPVLATVVRHGCWLEPEEYQVSDAIKLKGKEDLAHTSFYVPNEYTVSLAQQYQQFFIPAVSLHPYRKDALQALARWHEQGVKYIKWLPNSQGIDPSDKDIIPFYKKMAVYNMVLITHTGEENAVEGEGFQRLGNPQLLYLPFRHGVKIIMAHVAALGKCEDMQDAEREVSCFQLAIEMLKDERYEKMLFADISTIAQYSHVDKLEEILDKQSLHHRFVNGSDYPLPAINFLYKTSQLVEMGFISEDEREWLNEIYTYNPILFDFVLKRTIKKPGHWKKIIERSFSYA